jgi:predicted RNase H-like HicB family nuclease
MHLAYDLDDEIFIVTVPELPGCMTHGATRAEAVRKGEEAISSWLIAAEHWDTPIPAPAVVQFEAGLAEGEAAGPS